MASSYPVLPGSVTDRTTARARVARSASSWSTHQIRSSLRNHASCRRANFLVPNLVDQSGGPHAPHPLLDASVQHRARTVDPDLDGPRVDVLPGREGGAERPGELDDLEGPDDAAPVRRQDPGARLRVGLGEP